jgi:hypothetical protein
MIEDSTGMCADSHDLHSTTKCTTYILVLRNNKFVVPIAVSDCEVMVVVVYTDSGLWMQSTESTSCRTGIEALTLIHMLMPSSRRTVCRASTS